MCVNLRKLTQADDSPHTARRAMEEGHGRRNASVGQQLQAVFSCDNERGRWPIVIRLPVTAAQRSHRGRQCRSQESPPPFETQQQVINKATLAAAVKRKQAEVAGLQVQLDEKKTSTADVADLQDELVRLVLFLSVCLSVCLSVYELVSLLVSLFVFAHQCECLCSVVVRIGS